MAGQSSKHMRRNAEHPWDIDAESIVGITYGEASGRFGTHAGQAVLALRGGRGLERREAEAYLRGLWLTAAAEVDRAAAREGGVHAFVGKWDRLEAQTQEAASDEYSLWLIMRLMELARRDFIDGRAKNAGWMLDDLSERRMTTGPTASYVGDDMPGERFCLASKENNFGSGRLVPLLAANKASGHSVAKVVDTPLQGMHTHPRTGGSQRNPSVLPRAGSLWLVCNGVPEHVMASLQPGRPQAGFEQDPDEALMARRPDGGWLTVGAADARYPASWALRRDTIGRNRAYEDILVVGSRQSALEYVAERGLSEYVLDDFRMQLPMATKRRKFLDDVRTGSATEDAMPTKTTPLPTYDAVRVFRCVGIEQLCWNAKHKGEE